MTTQPRTPTGEIGAPGPRLAVVEVTRHRPHAPAYHAYVQSMNAHVVRTAEASGWQVTRLAAGDLGTEALLELTDRADAIVVLGGEDVSPHRYGGATGYRGEGRHDDVADAAQIALVHRAFERHTPVLGICRGHQIVNVALGGDLVQHLDDHDGLHRNTGAPVERLMNAHRVELVPGSRLASVLGDGVRAQSAHHQAVARLGRGLVAVGHSHDGTVEAIEHESAPITGVQWHPEDAGAPVGQLLALLDQLGARVRSSVLAA